MMALKRLPEWDKWLKEKHNRRVCKECKNLRIVDKYGICSHCHHTLMSLMSGVAIDIDAMEMKCFMCGSSEIAIRDEYGGLCSSCFDDSMGSAE